MLPTLQTNNSNDMSIVNMLLLNAAGWFTAEIAQYWHGWLSNGVLACTILYTAAKTIDIFRKKGGDK